jgi:hypothetical protein
MPVHLQLGAVWSCRFAGRLVALLDGATTVIIHGVVVGRAVVLTGMRIKQSSKSAWDADTRHYQCNLSGNATYNQHAGS